MRLRNRIKRLSALLTLLSKGYNLSTPTLAKRFGVSTKIIQTDFKDYLIHLFPDEKIYYDFSEKMKTPRSRATGYLTSPTSTDQNIFYYSPGLVLEHIP